MHLVFVFLQKINLSFIDSEKVQFHFFVFFFFGFWMTAFAL